MDSIVTELAQLTKALAAELEADLCKLINKHPYIQASPPCSLLGARRTRHETWIHAHTAIC